MFGNHGLCGLPEEGAHGKSPKCLGGNLGDFGEFCKGLEWTTAQLARLNASTNHSDAPCRVYLITAYHSLNHSSHVFQTTLPAV